MSTTDLSEGLIGPDDPEDPEVPGGNKGKNKDHPDRRTIVVTVYAPVEPDPKRFRFKLSRTVGDAARLAASEFGYDATSTPSFSTKDGTILDRNVTLEAAGVEPRDELELVDVGGGV